MPTRSSVAACKRSKGGSAGEGGDSLVGRRSPPSSTPSSEQQRRGHRWRGEHHGRSLRPEADEAVVAERGAGAPRQIWPRLPERRC
jgi:hypothetical protein